jgi:hypothetical protein
MGLLALAHERGLAPLPTRIEFHSDAMVLASATITFQDGQVFTQWATLVRTFRELLGLPGLRWCQAMLRTKMPDRIVRVALHRSHMR